MKDRALLFPILSATVVSVATVAFIYSVATFNGNLLLFSISLFAMKIAVEFGDLKQ